MTTKWMNKIRKTLSIRLSLMMLFAIGVLLIVALIVMFHFSWLAMKEEAMNDAEQTLEGTAQQIDNVLMSVEQASGNIYLEMIQHLDDPESMYTYCSELVKSNPYIVGCAIAFKPDYYPGRKLFMAYIHRKGNILNSEGEPELVRQDTYTSRPYTEQVWYSEPVNTGRPCWTDPLKGEDAEDIPLVSFCLPIYDKNKECVGTMATDLPISLLSQIVLSVKPSPQGYSTLLAENGSFIVHPDSSKLKHQTVFYQMEHGVDHSVLEAAEAMVGGEKGFLPFRMNGKKWYVFYKPFERTATPGRSEINLGWSVGVVYPDEDIFGMFNNLLYILIAISIVGLVLFYLLCRMITHRLLLPLNMLTNSAQRIAGGDYHEQIPDTTRKDEIGLLQEHFQQMQKVLSGRIEQLDQLSTTLKQRNTELEIAYNQAQKADKMKTTFLHNMTNQMVNPSNHITMNVISLCDLYEKGQMEKAQPMIDTISNQSKVMVDVLDDMLHTADKDLEKGGKS